MPVLDNTGADIPLVPFIGGIPTAAQTATIAVNAALSDVIDTRGFSSGAIITPSALDATSKIAFKGCNTRGGTYVGIYTAANALIEITPNLAASQGYMIPADVMQFPFIKIWTEASGADVAQAGGARVFQVMTSGL